jgi:hypothetical protein
MLGEGRKEGRNEEMTKINYHCPLSSEITFFAIS